MELGVHNPTYSKEYGTSPGEALHKASEPMSLNSMNCYPLFLLLQVEKQIFQEYDFRLVKISKVFAKLTRRRL